MGYFHVRAISYIKTVVYHAVLITILMVSQQTTKSTPVYHFILMMVLTNWMEFSKCIPVLPLTKTNEFHPKPETGPSVHQILWRFSPRFVPSPKPTRTSRFRNRPFSAPDPVALFPAICIFTGAGPSVHHINLQLQFDDRRVAIF